LAQVELDLRNFLLRLEEWATGHGVAVPMAEKLVNRFSARFIDSDEPA
jgi:hypothetical protein